MMIWKLLRQHVSPGQLAGFTLANLFGTAVVLLGLQFYADVSPLLTEGGSFMKKDYLVVSRRVSTLGTLTGTAATFGPREVDDLAAQPFARSVGAFVPARFKVTAGVSVQGLDFATELFFEAVPDRFVDHRPEGWGFRPEDDTLPIVLPRSYLNLYNFGFARSRRMPQLSEGVMGLLDLRVLVRGRGGSRRLQGRIVGFSDRLNTILVPEDFLRWANRTYGDEADPRPSRLIVEVDNPADDRIARYCKAKGYDTEDGRLDAGKTTWLLKTLTGIVLTVGLLISLLSFYLLLLSVFLLLQKNLAKLETLLLIGYSPAQVARPYQLLAAGLGAVSLVAAAAVAAAVRAVWLDTLQGVFPALAAGSVLPAAGAGVALYALVSALAAFLIRRRVDRLF